MLELTEADLAAVELTRKAIKDGNVEVINIDMDDNVVAKLRDMAADLPITWEELIVVLLVQQLGKPETPEKVLKELKRKKS